VSHAGIQPEHVGLAAVDDRTRANHRFKFRAVGASSSGLRSSFAAKTVGDWDQLLAVVVEQESPAAFKNQKSYYQSRLDWWQSLLPVRKCLGILRLQAAHAHCSQDSRPFRSSALSFPGAKRP